MNELMLEIEKLKANQIQVVGAEKQILSAKKEMEEAEKCKAIEVLKIEKEVLLNPEFKNENQRKVAIAEKLLDSVMVDNLEKNIAIRKEKIATFQFEISCLKAEIEYSRNMIEFYKLATA